MTPRTHAAIRRTAAAAALGVFALGLAACMHDAGADMTADDSPAGGNDTPPGYAPAVEPSGATRLVRMDGFMSPESVKYDADQDVYFVSNILGYGSVKDGNGYIVRLNAADFGKPEVLVQGGKNGVTLDAPKGMALHGDTLWVADIDQLRGFDRHSGAPLATIDLRPQHAVLLNDVAIGPDGSIHVTDTGIIMSDKGVIHAGGDKIFVIGANRAVSLQAQGASVAWPNGITWDAPRKRWVVVTFDPFRSDVYTMRDGDTTHSSVAKGAGRFDGVEVLDDGRILVTCWNDSSVHAFGVGKDERLVRHLSQPADLGLDTRRNRIAVPLGMLGRVEFWQLPDAKADTTRA